MGLVSFRAMRSFNLYVELIAGKSHHVNGLFQLNLSEWFCADSHCPVIWILLATANMLHS